MQEKDKRTIEELLAAYSDILMVGREGSLGGIWMSFVDKRGIRKDLLLGLARDNEKHIQRHLFIEFLPQVSGAMENSERATISFYPISEAIVSMNVKGSLSMDDIEDTIEKARRGLELFRAVEAIGFREIPGDKVYDRVSSVDKGLMNRIAEYEQQRAHEAGRTERYPYPKEFYLRMLELLNMTRV